jgi:hypothetical protein
VERAILQPFRALHNGFRGDGFLILSREQVALKPAKSWFAVFLCVLPEIVVFTSLRRVKPLNQSFAEKGPDRFLICTLWDAEWPSRNDLLCIAPELQRRVMRRRTHSEKRN